MKYFYFWNSRTSFWFVARRAINEEKDGNRYKVRFDDVIESSAGDEDETKNAMIDNACDFWGERNDPHIFAFDKTSGWRSYFDAFSYKRGFIKFIISIGDLL